MSISLRCFCLISSIWPGLQIHESMTKEHVVDQEKQEQGPQQRSHRLKNGMHLSMPSGIRSLSLAVSRNSSSNWFQLPSHIF